MTAKTRRSPCPIACTLDLIGDKWSLLIIRELFRGGSKFGDFAAMDEGIPTNILTSRLKRLVAAGLIERRRYCERPPRFEYVLTDKGRDLGELLLGIFRWGARHLPGTRQRLPREVRHLVDEA